MSHFIGDNPLRLLKVLILAASLLIAACAAKPKSDDPLPGYVEIDNPAQTMSPNAPAKIWVPRSYVESGVPRGGDLIKQGTEKVMQTFRKTPSQEQQPLAPQQPAINATPFSPTVPANQQALGQQASSPSFPTAPQTAAQAQPVSFANRVSVSPGVAYAVKVRIAILDTGTNGLAQPLYENLRRAGIGGLLDPVQTAYLAQYSSIGSEAEKATFATRLQQDYGANILIYVSAPDGVASGKPVVAEVYDTMAGGLVRKLEAVLSMGDTAELAEKNVAISSALGTFTDKIKELVAFLPWYGRITVVDGGRAYIAAGKEAGITVGMTMKIFRSGKFIKGLGYAPGELIGTLQVQGFVGPNGSFGQIREGQGVQPNDVVSAD